MGNTDFLTLIKLSFKPTWDEIFMQAAYNASQRAQCGRFWIGATLANCQKGKEKIIQTGYNGPVRGESHCFELRFCSKEKKGCIGSHAEMNAIVNAACSSVDISGATLYVTQSPCLECAKHIINSSLVEVVYLEHYGEIRLDKVEEAERALKLLSSKIICRKFRGRIIGADGSGGFKIYMY